ncbi:MAG: hypothetical protein ACO218_10255, partial [Steroidobacteraceae bacterium]
MIPELGHFALVLALLLALSQSWFGLVGAMQDRTAWMRAAQTSVAGQWWLLLLSFAALVWSFIQFDFSVAYVANTSNSLLPLFYRIAAAWGGHEGSLLLWALILASWSAAIVAF